MCSLEGLGSIQSKDPPYLKRKDIYSLAVSTMLKPRLYGTQGSSESKAWGRWRLHRRSDELLPSYISVKLCFKITCPTPLLL